MAAGLWLSCSYAERVLNPGTAPVHDPTCMQAPFTRQGYTFQVYRGRLRSTGEEVAVHALKCMQAPF